MIDVDEVTVNDVVVSRVTLPIVVGGSTTNVPQANVDCSEQAASCQQPRFMNFAQSLSGFIGKP